MAEPTSLSSILSDEAPPENKPAETPPPGEKNEGVVVEHDGLPGERTGIRSDHRMKELNERAEGLGMRRDPETGQFVKKDETPPPPPEEKKAETPPPPEPEKKKTEEEQMTERERGFLAAAREERQKRQELERRLEELEKGTAPPAEQKNFWDDPEGTIAKISNDFETKMTMQRLEFTERIARREHPDFQEKADAFAQLLQTTPGMREQWLRSPDPAEFAYQTGLMHLEVTAAGGVQNLRKSIEAKVRAEIEAEVKAKSEAAAKAQAEDDAKKAAEIPKPLSESRGSAPASKPVYTGPTPLGKILGEAES